MLLQGKRIFIVEDNLENRVVFEVLLAEQGASIAYERWGIATIERLQAFAPVDLILMDLLFPKGVTEYDIFQAIRAVPDLASIPVVAVSAADPCEAIPKTQKLGFSGYISKPINFQTFTGQIVSIIKGEAVWDDGLNRRVRIA